MAAKRKNKRTMLYALAGIAVLVGLVVLARKRSSSEEPAAPLPQPSSPVAGGGGGGGGLTRNEPGPTKGGEQTGATPIEKKPRKGDPHGPPLTLPGHGPPPITLPGQGPPAVHA